MAKAIVTLCSGMDQFIKGAIGSKGLMEKHAPDYTHAVIVEEGAYPDATVDYLRRIGYTVHLLPPLRSLPTKFAASRWPRTFTKLHVFGLTEYEKVLYMDADAALFGDPAEVFDLEPKALACSYFPKKKYRFRSGMILTKPSQELFEHACMWLGRDPQYNGAKLGDQGVLNRAFRYKFDPLPRGHHVVDWRNWKVGSKVIVGHLRPKPWRIKQKCHPRMRPFKKTWIRSFLDVVGKHGKPEFMR